MSESEWEALSSDGEEQALARSASPHPAPVSATIEVPAHGVMSLNRHAILKPLCITLNQTGTRVGVGHTRGFLVFRVTAASPSGGSAGDGVANSEADRRSSQATATSSASPVVPETRSRLVLDPQYNVDLLTFSHVRARLLQQQRLATSLPKRGEATTQWDSSSSIGAAMAQVEKDGIASEEDEEEDESDARRRVQDAAGTDLGLPLDCDDLGSFLTAAGRAFAQVRRGEHPSTSARVPANVKTSPLPTVIPGGGRYLDAPRVVENTAATAATVNAEPSTRASAIELSSLQTTPDLFWGDKSEIKENEVKETPQTPPSLGAGQNREEEEEEEEEEDYVGFEGGGVAVMALLYDQPLLALVGGGPTPMGPPNHVLFTRDGEAQHQLCLPHPIVHLFLDARLLFVCTTAELRLYTNPLERDWTALRHTISLSSTLSRKYADVLMCTGDSGTDKGAPIQIWCGAPCRMENANSTTPTGPVSARDYGIIGRDTVEGEKTPLAETVQRVASSTSGPYAALPIVPLVVDYARNLLLLPCGEDLKGFTLYRYVSGPEPIATSRNTATTSAGVPAAGAMGSGRTTAYMHCVATQPLAHKNPLHNLVLYVGWPAATTRLVDSAASATPSTIEPSNSLSSIASVSSVSSLTSATATTGAGGRAGPVTLVAAASEYATRLTLWMLRTATGAEQARATPGDGAQFVLLREFRLGLRLAPPPSVVAALPGVSRFMTRASANVSTTAAPEVNPLYATHDNANTSSLSDLPGREVVREASPNASGLFISSLPSASRSKPRTAFTSTGSVTAWAAEAAAMLSSTSTGTPSVHHLQFLDKGAYLLCVHGTDHVSVFSTSAPESQLEAKNVCRDRVAAEQNRYSRLSMVKEYLPKMLSIRLEAYTRQAWSSCAGLLPVQDSVFVPRWVYLQCQDAVAAPLGPASRRSLTIRPATAGTRSTGAEAGDQGGRAGAHATSSAAKRGGGGRRLFHRLSSLISPGKAANTRTTITAPPTAATPLSLSSTMDPVAAMHARSDDHIDPLTTSTVAAEPSVAVRRGWGVPLTLLPQCLCVWLATPASVAGVGAGKATGKPPVVLNCATCEGAFANILFMADVGAIEMSRAVPYASE